MSKPLMAAAGAVLLLVGGRLPLGALVAVTIVWTTFVVAIDRSVLRRSTTPGFWLAALLFAVASGLFLGPADTRVLALHVSWSGLTSGIHMLMRAVVIVTLIGWALDLLRTRRVATLLARASAGRRASEAASAAACMLPGMMQRLRGALVGARAGARRERWTEVAVELLADAAELGGVDPEVRVQVSPRVRIAAVVGAARSGKTSLLAHVAGSLDAAGIRVGGVLQRADGGEPRPRYRICDVATGAERPFARPRRGSKAGYRFAWGGWSWARRRVQAARATAAVIVVDEVGLQEAQGRGHLPVVLATGRRGGQARVLLLGVRGSVEARIRGLVGDFDARIEPDASPRQVLAFVEQLRGWADVTKGVQDHAG